MTTETKFYCPECKEYHPHAEAEGKQIRCLGCNHVYDKPEPVDVRLRQYRDD